MGVRLLHYADLENAFDHPEQIGRLAGSIRERRGEDALVLGSGDDLAVGTLATVTERGKRQADPFFEAIQPDVETIGNHDLDEGRDEFLDSVRETPATWVCANAFEGDQRFGAEVGIVPWAVLTVADEDIGVVGIAHPETASLASIDRPIEFTDPIDAATESIDRLEDQGVDHVVLLTHVGSVEDLARATTADVVLGGHRHDRRVGRVEGAFVSRPDGNGRDLIEIDLDRDAISVHEVKDGPIDDELAAIYRRRWREEGLDEVVGTVENPIERSYETRFWGESRIGNLIADAYRWATDADVGIAFAGGIRLGPPLAGEVSVGDLVGTVPFDDDLVVVERPGRELRALLANAEGGGPEDDPPWWHLHVSGARVVWDHERTAVTSLQVGNEPIESDQTYSIATTEFLLDLEGFPVLSYSAIVDRFDDQYEHVIEYARECGIDPTIDGRITRRELD